MFMGYLAILSGFGRLKTKPNKANLFRIAYCVVRIAKRSLKKQSQFISYWVLRNAYCGKAVEKTKPILGKNKRKKAKMSVNLVFYRVNSWLIWKNKANFRKGETNVSIYLRREYDKLCGFGRPKNKANSKPISRRLDEPDGEKFPNLSWIDNFCRTDFFIDFYQGKHTINIGDCQISTWLWVVGV